MTGKGKPVKDKKSISEKSALYIRAPQSYHDDIEKLCKITGLTKTAVCLEILRVGIKNMLNETKK